MSQSDPPQTDIPETLLSLLVAFSIALAFRGFVVEGFVIPTGSMAPTLMGQHVRFRTPDTGYEYALDPTALAANISGAEEAVLSVDPMISQDRGVGQLPARAILSRVGAGDRVLVLKYLYAFFEPDHWDVVVFKNPVDPIGPSQNYIKRLAGLPGEQVLIVDGDVFTAPPGADLRDFRIARRPRHVQESIWQPVYDSDYVPLDPSDLQARLRRVFDGPPFKSSDSGWTLADARTWRCENASDTRLDWAGDQLPIDDFNAYNVYRYDQNLRENRLLLRDIDPVSDIRVSAVVAPDDGEAFGTTLQLETRAHRFDFTLNAGVASISMLDATGARVASSEGRFEPGPGGLIDLVFTHVDQSLTIEIGGVEVVRLEYEWNPSERLSAAYIEFDLDRYRSAPKSLRIRSPRLSWRFAGTPFEMTRIRVERDLHYKTGRLDYGQQVASNGPYIDGMLHATDPLQPAVLGPDQFLMLGDNSGASRDSRYWGRPHPLSVMTTGDDAPFVVPRDMLVGKAWCVYFPAPTPIAGSGPRLMPDFGRLRFIR
jgi:signal peptidase I